MTTFDCALFPSLSSTTDRTTPAQPPIYAPLVPWPGPSPRDLTPGELTLSSSSPWLATVIVRAIGEIDLATAPALTRMLLASSRILMDPPDVDPPDAAPTPRPPRLVCDLSPVTFFGASGLSALVEGTSGAAERGIELRVVAPHRIVRRPLELTGVARRMGLEDSLTAATGDLPDQGWHDRDQNEGTG